MPWNESTQTMTTPININDGGDIQQATRCSSGDLGYCIVNGEIVKWSLHKPVPYPSWSAPDSGWNGMRNQAQLVNGMTVPNASTIGTLESQSGILEPKSGFIYDVVNGNAVWNYLRPTGIPSEQFRQLDFDGYTRAAVNPFPLSQTVAIPLSENYQFNAVLTINTAIINGTILLSDLTSGSASPFTGYYAGAVLYRTRNGKIEAHFASAIQPLNNTSENKHLKVPFTLPAVTGSYTPVGDWTLKSFLSNVPLTADSLTQPQTLTDLVACDDAGSQVTLSLYGGRVTAALSAKNLVSTGLGKVKITVTLLNQTPNTVTISNSSAMVLEMGEVSETVSLNDLNVSIPAAGEVSAFEYTVFNYPTGLTVNFSADVAGTPDQTTVTATATITH